jgi:hypothetical protein
MLQIMATKSAPATLAVALTLLLASHARAQVEHTLVQELRQPDSIDGIRGIPQDVGTLHYVEVDLDGDVHIAASCENATPYEDGVGFTAGPGPAIVWQAQQYDPVFGYGHTFASKSTPAWDGVDDCAGPSFVELEDTGWTFSESEWQGASIPPLFSTTTRIVGTSYAEWFLDYDWWFEWTPVDIVVAEYSGPDYTFLNVKGTVTYELTPNPLAPWIQIPYCSSTPNSTGDIALLYAGGSNNVADELLFLSVEHAPLNYVGYFLVSPAQANVPDFGGGAGTLCLGAPIHRVLGSVGVPNSLGHVAYWWDPEATPVQFATGEVWNFQYWFRDNPGAGGTNTSNGLSITFE